MMSAALAIKIAKSTASEEHGPENFLTTVENLLDDQLAKSMSSLSARRRAEVAAEVARDVKPDDSNTGELLRRWARARAATAPTKACTTASVRTVPATRAREHRAVRRAGADSGGAGDGDGDGPSDEDVAPAQHAAPELRDVLTVDEVAAYLRVNRKTIYEEIQKKRLFARRVGRILRISRVALLDYLYQGRTPHARRTK